jgi:hypothetical protein
MDIEKSRKEYRALEENKRALLKGIAPNSNIYEVGGKKVKLIVEKQKAICEELKQSFRLTEVNRRVIAWRKKAMAHPEVKAVIEQYHIPIESVALAECGRDAWNFRADYHYKSSYFFSANYKHNRWETMKVYVYGGPKDPVEILFKHVPGFGFEFVGVFLKKAAFPKKGVISLFAKGSVKKTGKKAA